MTLPSPTTPRSRRPIVPELRDVPLTWMDYPDTCPLRVERVNFNDQKWDGCLERVGSCQLIRDLKKCPRGIPA